MYANTEKDDLRSVKTEKALEDAMLSLLKYRNFRKVTVKDICDEAWISRATFYAHFNDKYDFLKNWLSSFMPVRIDTTDSYEIMEKKINQFVKKNESILKNLLFNADEETLGIIFDFVVSILNFNVDKDKEGKVNPRYVILHSFYAGGIFNYILWQIRNKFPLEMPPMNMELYEVICKFQDIKSDKNP